MQYCASNTELTKALELDPNFSAEISYKGFTSLGSCDFLSGPTYSIELCTTEFGGTPTADCPEVDYRIQGQIAQLPIDLRAPDSVSYWDYVGSTWRSTAMVIEGYGVLDTTPSGGVLRLDHPFDSVYCVTTAEDLSAPPYGT